MVIDWLAAGLDPAQATLFIQSRVPEHAELHRCCSHDRRRSAGSSACRPTRTSSRSSRTGICRPTASSAIPLLQGADILIYRANMVPVGEDQVPHVELTREIARRFNHIYGREPGFEEKAEPR